MPSNPDLVDVLARYRVDAIATAVLAFLACGFSRYYVRRRGAANELSGITCVTVVALAVAGALLAEWTAMVLGYPASADVATVMMPR